MSSVAAEKISDNSGPRLLQLDILRAIAVVLVLGSHLRPSAAGLHPITVVVHDFFRSYGGLGVQLFFVLSGFLVSGLLFREHQRTSSVRVGRFLLRRGLKIYPAFYVFFVSTVLIRMWLGEVFSRATLLSEALFVQNYFPGLWSHTWTLAVEEHFYLLLAVTVAFLVRNVKSHPFHAIPSLFLVVTVGVLASRAWTLANGPYTVRTHLFPTHLQIDSLFFGVLISWYYHFRESLCSLSSRQGMGLLIGGVALLVISQTLPAGMFRYVAGHVLVYVSCGAIVLGSLCLRGPVWRPVRRLAEWIGVFGSYSYSVYLWHTAVLVFGGIIVDRLFGDWGGYYFEVFWYLTGSIVFGIAMSKCIEVPVLRFRDRYFPSTRRPGVGRPSRSGPAAVETVF